MKEFAGKVALITGGNAGIGRATAVEFAGRGAAVVISGRRETEGHEVVDGIKASGGDALFVKADVSKERDVVATIQQTLATFGRLDFAFNNAGVEQALMPLSEQTEELFDQVMSINVKGVWLSLKHEIPAMLKTGSGAIVNNSSIAGVVGVALAPIYIASKHAVIGLTKAVALEYAKHNIRVNAVAPGTIETRMFYEVAKDPEIRQMFALARRWDASASRRRSQVPSPGSVPTPRRSSSVRRSPSTEAIRLSSSPCDPYLQCRAQPMLKQRTLLNAVGGHERTPPKASSTSPHAAALAVRAAIGSVNEWLGSTRARSMGANASR